MSKEVLATAKEKMTKAEESLRRELGQIRVWSCERKSIRPYSSRILWCTNTS